MSQSPGQVTGAYDIEVVKSSRSVEVTGTAAQLEKAEKVQRKLWALGPKKTLLEPESGDVFQNFN